MEGKRPKGRPRSRWIDKGRKYIEIRGDRKKCRKWGKQRLLETFSSDISEIFKTDIRKNTFLSNNSLQMAYDKMFGSQNTVLFNRIYKKLYIMEQSASFCRALHPLAYYGLVYYLFILFFFSKLTSILDLSCTYFLCILPFQFFLSPTYQSI